MTENSNGPTNHSSTGKWLAKLSDSALSHAVAVAIGVAYGALVQLLVRTDLWKNQDLMGVMSLGYVFVLPGVVGFITVLIASRTHRVSLLAALFLPWSAVIACLGLAAVVGWEGLICLFLAMPVYVVIASVGGFAAWLWSVRRAPRSMQVLVYSVALILPLGSSAIEQNFESPVSLRTVPSSIDIDASADKVWPLVVRVDTIAEPLTGVFYRMGFPKPLDAVLDRDAVGGVRSARFEGNLVFIETVTDFEPRKRLGFSIKADPRSTPTTTLDPHVTVGGSYFDVLYGQYDLEPLSDGRTRLHLLSRFRVSTHFNAYAGWWGEFLMHDIQQSILHVLKRRAERSLE